MRLRLKQFLRIQFINPRRKLLCCATVCWAFLAPTGGDIIAQRSLDTTHAGTDYSVSMAARSSVTAHNSLQRPSDTLCRCHPSLPLEIVASSLIAGLPAYFGYRAFFDDTFAFQPEIGLIPVSFLGYMLALGFTAAWTAGCDANWWNAVWIGFGSNVAVSLLYGAVYGNTHILNINKINWPEYLALGVAPTVLASVVYNQFLHPHQEERHHSSDDGMYLLPAVGGDKSLSLNFGVRF